MTHKPRKRDFGELKSKKGGREGREIFSLHDHNFFHRDKHKYFHSGVEIVISLVVMAFCEYTHHYLITLKGVKNHSLHGVKFFPYIYINTCDTDPSLYCALYPKY